MSKSTGSKSATKARHASAARAGARAHVRAEPAITAGAQFREHSKLARIITLLRSKGGATIEQMMKATGWQAHSVRGALSGAVKKKRGLEITSEMGRDCSRIYRIAG